MNSTFAGTAGRLAGTAARGLIWAHRTIEWAEVAAVVLHGLQVLVVLTLLAGRATRRAWDALVPISERLGKVYSRWLVGQPATATPTIQPAAASPLEVIATAAQQALEPLPVLQLRRLARAAGLPRALSRTGRKAELLAALVGLEVALI